MRRWEQGRILAFATPDHQRHITREAVQELKLDCFRALAYIENDEGCLVSRNGNTFASFRDLAAQVARKFLRAVNAK